MQAIKFGAEDIDQPTVTFKPEDVSDPLDQVRENQRAKFPTEAEGSEPIIRPWSLGTIVGTAARDLNPLNLIHPFSRPVETAEELGKARFHSENKVGEAVNDWRQTGDKLALAEAVTRGAANMVPVVGPFIVNAAEEAGRDPSAGAGHVAAAIAGPKIYKAVGDMDLSTPRALIDKVRENGFRATLQDTINERRGVNPQTSLFKALRPRNFVRDADKRINGAMPEINAGAKLTGKPVNDLASMNEAIDAQVRERLKQQAALIGDDKFAISGKPVADAVWRSIPKLDLLRLGEDGAAALHESIYGTWDRDFTPQQLAEFLKDSNASRSVQGYFAKLPGQQIALDRVVDKASAMAENHAIRQTLIDALENYKGTGEGLRQVNLALRDLISTKDLLDRRYNVEVRQAVENLPQQVSKLAALGLYGKAAKALIGGHPGVAALDVFTGMGEKEVADFIRELNSTNGQIASAFRRFKGEPAPVPMNPVSRYDRALPPASSAVEPTSETGSGSPGSLSSVSQWQRPRAIGLPAVSNELTSANRADLVQRMTEVPKTKMLTAGREPMQLPESENPGQYYSGSPRGSGGKKVGQAESPRSQREFLNLSTAEYEIQRDPATGRFKKVYKGTSKETKK